MNGEQAFCVNLDSPIAVYTQIENQVQFAIASGRLKPGDTLPSVREMSLTLQVNPNTVTKAYRDLEIMQLLQTRRGVGVTVTESGPKLCRDSVTRMVKAHLEEAVGECTASGISGTDVKQIVATALQAKVVPYKPVAKK